MDWDTRLGEIHRGGKWILAVDAVAAATPLVEQLRKWDADVMVVGSTEGVGIVPEGVPIHYTRSRGETIMLGFRAFFASLTDPSPALVAAVTAFDPEGEARVITPPFGTLDELVGRRVYGGRPLEWAALEDKMVVDDLWDAAGIPRSPAEIVPVAQAPAAAARLSGDLGTVWVADNTEGWHGGGDYTRWVPGPDAVADAVAWFGEHARRVRVMPFLDGIPCSIHGYITSDGVAVFRPVEIVILRRRDPAGFIYAGAATFWDPPDRVREEMRQTARLVAAELGRRVGYVGGFCIDGVCTPEGFRPTELNPRLSAGLGMLAAATDFPLGTVTRSLIAGDMEIEAAWLEDTIVTGADATRMGGMGLPILADVEAASTGVLFGEDGAVATDPEAEADATMEVGPSSSGSYVRMHLDPERVEIGSSVAPYAVQAAALAARLWDFDLPPLEPAPDLCSGPRLRRGRQAKRPGS